MRFRKITLTLIGVLLALLCASTACFGGGKPSIDIMKKMPMSSTSFDYWAIEKLGDDNDLRGTIFPKFAYSSEAAQLKEVMVLADIKYAGKASGFDGSVRVFSNPNCHCEPFAFCHSERSEESHGAQDRLRKAIP